jgi:radical SAM protein with 4Fe4S-binding SPASM domain
VLISFLNEFRALGGYAIGWSGGGEPTLYPHLAEAIEAAADIGLEQGLFTNGLFSKRLIKVLGENMTWVRFALDTVDKESFSKKRGVTENALGTVLNNMKQLSGYPTRIISNTELAAWNADHMEDFIETSKQYGADIVQIRPALPRPYMNEKVDRAFYIGQLPKLREYEQMGDKDFQVFISWDKFDDLTRGEPYGRTYDKCQYHHFFCVLNANGDMGVCMYRLDNPNFIFGNIYAKTVKEIWEGNKRKEVIKYCNGQIDFSECQICCKGLELNKILHFIQNPNPKSDPDFF